MRNTHRIRRATRSSVEDLPIRAAAHCPEPGGWSATQLGKLVALGFRWSKQSRRLSHREFEILGSHQEGSMKPGICGTSRTMGTHPGARNTRESGRLGTGRYFQAGLVSLWPTRRALDALRQQRCVRMLARTTEPWVSESSPLGVPQEVAESLGRHPRHRRRRGSVLSPRAFPSLGLQLRRTGVCPGTESGKLKPLA